MSQIHESIDKIDEAFREVDNIESITKDPTCYINRRFDLNKNRITWRRNELISDINKYSDQLIQENESNRTRCLQLSDQTNNIARKIDFLKEELFDLKKLFDTFDANEAQLRCEQTKYEAIYLKERLNKTLKDYQESLLLNNELTFGFFDQPIEEIVGKMFDKNQIETTDNGRLWEENLLHRNDESLPEIKIEPSLAEHETIELLDSPLPQLNTGSTYFQHQDSEGIQMVYEKSKNSELQVGQNISPHKDCIESKVKTLTICGYSYKFQYQNKNKNSYYYCKKRLAEKCSGQIILSPNGIIVKQSNHICKLLDVQYRYKILEEVQEYEEIGGRFKINGYFYNFRSESKSKHKYYLCNKRRNTIKCRGSITVSQNHEIVKKIEHTCNPLKNKNRPFRSDHEEAERQLKNKEVESSLVEPGTIKLLDSPLPQSNTESTYVPVRRMLKNKIAACVINNNNQPLIITVDGYTYKFKTQFKNKNKYFRCEKSKTERCRGSVTLSPYETVVRKRFHTCSCICKIENKTLEEVHEYEETDKKTKINGHFYHFRSESKIKSKYYLCNKRNTQKCRGSITISANREIVKKVEHTCI